MQMFRQGKDIFTELSRRWLGGESAAEREKTKRIVYAVMYGAGPQKLAEYLQVSITEANSIIDNFVGRYNNHSVPLLTLNCTLKPESL